VTHVSPRLQRWLGSNVVLGLVTLAFACDRRFEFDTEAGGAGGGGLPAVTGGSSLGGAAGGISGGNGGVSGTAPAGAGTGNAGAAAAGEAGTGGSTACGTLAEFTAGTHCSDGGCVECVSDLDCATYGFARCEPMRHRCVACLSTADCEAGFACDSLANRCLQTCVDDDACPITAHGCDERRQVCYQCDEDRECATSANGHLCASDRSGCVQCRKETDCPNQHCDQLSGRCVECRDGGDCVSRICDPKTFSCTPE
jgi:hypothetical protein